MKLESLFIIGLLVLFVSCSHKQIIIEEYNVKYKVEVALDESEVMNLSENTDMSRYVALETTNEALIKHVEKLFVTDTSIIVYDDKLGEIFLFRKNGKYIRKFGQKGSGPKEHILFGDVFLDEHNRKLYASDVMKRSM